MTSVGDGKHNANVARWPREAVESATLVESGK
jgi:hypothetical protein